MTAGAFFFRFSFLLPAFASSVFRLPVSVRAGVRQGGRNALRKTLCTFAQTCPRSCARLFPLVHKAGKKVFRSGRVSCRNVAPVCFRAVLSGRHAGWCRPWTRSCRTRPSAVFCLMDVGLVRAYRRRSGAAGAMPLLQYAVLSSVLRHSRKAAMASSGRRLSMAFRRFSRGRASSS